MSEYDDMINLPRHKSKSRSPMPIIARAAQFSPFAALAGYDSAIKETARETKRKIELDPYMKEALDYKLEILVDQLEDNPEVKISYFQEDERKDGGAYITSIARIIKIDQYQHIIYMADGSEIPIDDILDIEGKIFDKLCDE